MADIYIPFTPQMREAAISGIKTATTRTRRYGYRGDEFYLDRQEFIIIDVLRIPLGEVAQDFYRWEGFDDQVGFIAYWSTLHPRKGYDSDQMVFLHLFRKEIG